MRVFLTGGTGYIGSAVLDALLRGGHRVTAIVRDPEKAARLTAKGVTPVVGELGTPSTFLPALEGTEAVIHTAFEGSPRGVEKDRLAIETLLASLKPHAAGDVPAFIYTSGVWVLG